VTADRSDAVANRAALSPSRRKQAGGGGRLQGDATAYVSGHADQ
jgi:hypothetical protein